MLDQDFTPDSYFTLPAGTARTRHSQKTQPASWTDGARRLAVRAFGFTATDDGRPGQLQTDGYRRTDPLKNANENDKTYRYAWGRADERAAGVVPGERFRMLGRGSPYHESNHTAGRWWFTAGLVFDFGTRPPQLTTTRAAPATRSVLSGRDRLQRLVEIDNRRTLKQNFGILPKFSVMYA